MPILDVDVQKKIIAKVGDIDPINGDPLPYGVVSISGVVGQNMTLLWASHADKAQITPRLRELFVERDAYDLLLGQLTALVDYALEGEAIKLSQRADRLIHRRLLTDAEILSLEKVAMNRRGPAVGQITTVAPVSPPMTPIRYPYGPDGNNPTYGGSVYGPFRRNN